MHTVIIKQDVYKKNPWAAVNLFKAFCEAKDLILADYFRTEALHVSLPWGHDDIARTKKILGEDWWPYGISKNRIVLDTFLRYHYEQGLSEKRMTIEDLFATETLDEPYII